MSARALIVYSDYKLDFGHFREKARNFNGLPPPVRSS
jgi:hypothetical protein